jgi:hypothetical protein
MKKYREHWAKTENRTKTQTTTQIKTKTKTKRHLGIPKPAATKLSILDTQSIHSLQLESKFSLKKTKTKQHHNNTTGNTTTQQVKK